MKKTALITGASRGIGLAFCRQLVQEDYRVIGLCRQSSFELENLDVKIIDSLDLKDIPNINKLPKILDKERIDLLINNAGIGLEDGIDDMNFTRIQEHFLTNAVGPLALSRCLLPLMNNYSKMAFITSRMASITDNSSGASYAYRMSKAALNMAAKNLAIDLKNKNIAVAILSPGMVDTDMLRALGITTGADAPAVAMRLISIINKLNLENSGTFWHINGSILPW